VVRGYIQLQTFLDRFLQKTSLTKLYADEKSGTIVINQSDGGRDSDAMEWRWGPIDCGRVLGTHVECTVLDNDWWKHAVAKSDCS
jgi:hypothetical protein